MRYADCRDQIATGDLIAIRKRTGFLPVLTRWVTRSPYTHTALALWAGDRLLVAESKGSGNFFTPLSQYEDTDFDVFAAPARVYLRIGTVIWAMTGKHVGYGFFDLVLIALNRLFGVPLPEHDDDEKVCSAMSAAMWLEAGWRPLILPSIPAPDDVVRACMAAPKWMVRVDG